MNDDRSGARSTGPATDSELPPQSGNGLGFFAVLVIVAVFGFGLANLLQTPPGGNQHIPAPGLGLIGMKAPAIEAQGWFNGTAPTEDELRGKIILIDAWAYWCGPCRRKAPGLIKLYEKYHPQGVVFLGLTTEDRRMLKQSEEFIESLKIPWPQGYGADKTLARLNADFIPKLWVIDQTGKIVWDETAEDDVSKTLDQLLK